MKIFLITLEYPPQKGGVASYYGGLVEELKRQGHEVEVVANYCNSKAPSPQPSPAGRGGLLLSRWIWPRWLRGYFLVRKRLKMYGGKASGAPEALPLLFVGHILPLGTVAYLLRRRVPYVVFTHGMDVLTAQKSWRKRHLARRILQSAKLVVANSEFTKGEVEKFIYGGPSAGRPEDGPQNIVVVYPCPTIAPEVKPEDVEVLRSKLGLSGKKVLLTLGRVVERKGHDLVIKALPEILKHVPEVVYVVAGDGPDLERLQKMMANPHPSPLPEGEGMPINSLSSRERMSVRTGEGLQSAVRFVGEVSDAERPLYYAMCDLFVMPARQIGPVRARVRLGRTTSNGAGPDVEGFGIVFLEAAVFGKPSVGGRSGGQSEAILDGKTGALVDPSDSAALARVTVQLLRDDGLRDEMGKNAKARAVYEFMWEKQVEKLIQAITSP